MEPVTSIVSAIFKVLQEIAKAEREARRNRTRCRDLARRAQVVSNVLRDARTAGNGNGNGKAAATRRMILCRLREALDDALKLVESCGGRDGGGRRGLSSLISGILNSGARVARFDDVDKRISNCLVELNAASGASIERKIDRLAVAARDHHPPRTNKPKETRAGNAPNKGGQSQNGGKGGKQKRRGKKKAAAASRPPPPSITHAGVPFYPNGHCCTVHHHHHSMEEDPNSCSVM